MSKQIKPKLQKSSNFNQKPNTYITNLSKVEQKEDRAFGKDIKNLSKANFIKKKNENKKGLAEFTENYKTFNQNKPSIANLNDSMATINTNISKILPEIINLPKKNESKRAIFQVAEIVDRRSNTAVYGSTKGKPISQITATTYGTISTNFQSQQIDFNNNSTSMILKTKKRDDDDGLTPMDRIFKHEILYTVEYIVDIFKELFNTQVNFLLRITLSQIASI